MRISAAFASSLTAATFSAVLWKSAVLFCLALVLFGVVLAFEVAQFVLLVCRPADRKDLLKFYRVWRGR